MESSMKKYWKALVNVGVAIIIFLCFILLLPRLLVFFIPFLIGWFIALLASPLVRFFEEKIKIRRKASSVFVIIVVIGLVVLGMYLVGGKFVKELMGFINELPVMWIGIEKDLAEIAVKMSGLFDKLPKDIQFIMNDITKQANTYVGELFSKLSTPTIAAVGNFAKQLPSAIIAIIMSLLSSYFFVAERNTINEWLRNHTPNSILVRFDMLKRGLKRAVGGYFKAQLKIEFWMYLILVIGLSILKVEYSLLIALGIAILDFLPFFGTGTIMVPWAIISILSGEYKMAIGLLIIWGGGQLIRQIIQPKIVGDSVGVPPIPTLFLLFIGFKVGGVIGMIVAVPIGLILYTMYEEGVFDTTKNSILILIKGINRFRKLHSKDLEYLEQTEDKEK